MSVTTTSTIAFDPQAVLIGRVLDEFLIRRSRGENISEEALLAEHPELANELQDHLAVVAALRRPANTLKQLLRLGVLKAAADIQFLAQIDGYLIERFVGQGGMGIVLQAYEPALDRRVAVKVLRPELADDSQARARFEREAKAAAGLNHPSIVTVHGIGEVNGFVYIAMEYVAGPSLADLIAHHAPLPDAWSSAIFKQLMAALAAAHEGGIIHRDIKPSNILLEGLDIDRPAAAGNAQSSSLIDPATSKIPAPSGVAAPPMCECAPEAAHLPIALSPTPPETLRIKLVDFGLARLVSAQTRMTTEHAVLGTPEYMSPEQARGDENIDHRTDLWSAGVVLFEMLTGTTPFRAETPGGTVRRLLESESSLRRFDARIVRNKQLRDVASWMVEPRIVDRPASATDALMSLNISAPLFSWRAWKRGVVRHWRASVVVAVCMLLSTLGVVLWQRSEAPEVNTPSLSRAVSVAGDPRGQDPQGILRIRYDIDDTYRVFVRVPAAESITAAELVDMDGDGKSDRVAAGFGQAVPRHILNAAWANDETLVNIALFDEAANCTAAHYLGDDASIEWPDRDNHFPYSCAALAAGDIDGRPGDELIASAHDKIDYPTRITVLDPISWRELGTYWHMGQINTLCIVRTDENVQRPMLIALGTNNKLDGFRNALPEAGVTRASFDYVPAAMLLDPLNMDGIGPPFATARLGLAPAPIAAYAFLDIPTARSLSQAVQLNEKLLPDILAGTLWSVGAADASETPGAWLEFTLEAFNESPYTLASIVIDHQLELVDVRAANDLVDPTVIRERWKTLDLSHFQHRALGEIIGARHNNEDRQTLEVKRVGSDWQALYRLSSGETISSEFVSPVDADSTPDVLVGTESETVDGRLLAISSTGKLLWETDFENAINAPPASTSQSTKARWGVGRVIPCELDGMPRGSEFIVILNEWYGVRTRLYAIRREDGTARYLDEDKLGHAQRTCLAPLAPGNRYALVLVIYSMLSSDDADILLHNSDGSETSLANRRYSDVPRIAAYWFPRWGMPTDADNAGTTIRTESVLFDVPARDMSTDGAADGAVVDEKKVLVVDRLDYAPELDSIIAELTPHSNISTRWRLRLHLDSNLAIHDCEAEAIDDNAAAAAEEARKRVISGWRSLHRASSEQATRP